MRKRDTLCLALLIMLTCGIACAESFFPRTSELFGAYMPSLQMAIGREPNAVDEINEGTIKTFQDFSIADYQAFCSYLEKSGCELSEQDSNSHIYTAVISRGGGRCTFTYDATSRVATILYPTDTREETEQSESTRSISVLPEDIRSLIGYAMPSMNPCLSFDQEPITVAESGYESITYTNIHKSEYAAFSQYLKFKECTVIESSFENGCVIATISQGEANFVFRYDMRTEEATLIYPELYFIDDTEIEIGSDIVGVLPDCPATH